MSETRERPPRPPGTEDERQEQSEHRARAGGSKRAGQKVRSTAASATIDAETVKAAEAASTAKSGKSDVATIERVIRRATKLQMARSANLPASEEGLTDADILRIGEELGLDGDNVRQALLEVRTEKARPKGQAEKGLAAKVLGGKFVRASRPVSRPAAEVQRVLEQHLGDPEGLAEVRRSTGASLWVPATGLVTKIQRGLNLGRRAYILSKAQEIYLSVARVDEDNCLVTLTANIANQRREKAAAWFIGSPFLVAPGVIALALLGMPFEFAMLTGAAGAGTTAISATRVAVGNQRREMQLALDGLLDRLAAGVPLEEPRGSFQERFLR